MSSSDDVVHTSSSRSTLSSHSHSRFLSRSQPSPSSAITSLQPVHHSTSASPFANPKARSASHVGPATPFSLSRGLRTSSSFSTSLTRDDDDDSTRRLDVLDRTAASSSDLSPVAPQHTPATHAMAATTNGHVARPASNKRAASSPPQLGFVSPKRRTPEVITIDDDGVEEDELDELDDDDDEEHQSTSNVQSKSMTTNGSTSKKLKTASEEGRRVYCHQDHQAHDTLKETMLTCSATKTTGKGHQRPCNLAYCAKCLNSRYAEDADKIKASNKAWKCPMCRGICNCSNCRKKQNLAPTGPLGTLVQSKGLKNASELLKKDPTATSNRSTTRPRTSAPLPPAPKAVASRSLSRSVGPSSSTNGQKSTVKGSVAKTSKTNGHTIVKLARAPRGPFSMDVDSDSSLSSLSSDEDDHPKTAPAPTTVAAPSKRRNPPPRAPKHVRAPKTYPLSRSSIIPSTGLLLARLHLRSFILRFTGFAPVLTSESAKIRSVLGALADDRDGWVWSREGDVAQRFMLQALCELIDTEEETIATEEGSAKLLRRLGRETVGNQNEKDRAWDTLREVLEQENVWEDGGWGDEVARWEAEREEAELVQVGGVRETRGRRGEMSPDERLALMLALVELAYAAECVRKDFVDGVEAERTAMVGHNRAKFQHRHECEDRRKTLLAEKPERPTKPLEASPTKKSKAMSKHDQELAEWVAKCAEIDEKLKEEEKDWQKELNEIHRDVYLVTAENRLRFAPVGTDFSDNAYWLLSPSSASKYPLQADPADDDYPLSWSVLVHGTPYSDIDPAAALASDGKTLKGKVTRPPSPPPTPGTIAAVNSSRAEQKDAWFIVSDPDEMDRLVNHLEWQTKWAEYEVRKARYDKTDAGTRELTPASGQAEDDEPVKDISELVSQLRIFADYVAAEREDALHGSRKARKVKKRRF